MAQPVKLNSIDRRLLSKIDEDVEIDSGNEVAVIAGEMEVKIMRFAHEAGDQFELRLRFPGNEELDVVVWRKRLLEQFNIKMDDQG